LRLELPHLGGRALPIRGLGQRLRPRTQVLLLRHVGGPLVLALLEVLLAAREELVAGAAEPRPHRVRLAPRRGPDLLPARLERLELLARLEPVGGVGERPGPRRQLLLELQVLRLFRLLRREVAVDLLLERRARGLIP